jgi:hypothetical protein
MPATLEWFNADKTILLETFEGHWTLQDFCDLVDQAADTLATVEHTVHIILDLANSAALTAQLTSGMRYALRKLPPNQGIVVFVGADTFVQVAIGIVSKLSPPMVDILYMAGTLPQAEAIITQLDTENPAN